MGKLSSDLQRILGQYSQNSHGNLQVLTNALQMAYRSTFSSNPSECGDELVPASSTCIDKKDPIGVDKGIKRFFIKYRWPYDPQREHAEFTGKIDNNASINKDDYIDRLGPAKGAYASPVPKSSNVFSVAERSLPYWFLAQRLTDEPSYHRYRVLRPVDYAGVRKAVKVNRKLDPREKRILMCKLQTGEFLYGDVAPVKAFGKQGTGGGKQYYFCIPVYYLIRLGFLREERRP